MSSDASNVIFFGKGRLGNQLIQAAALRKLFPRAKVSFFAAKSMLRLIAPDEKVGAPEFDTQGWLGKRKLALVRLVLRTLSLRLRLIGYIKEESIYQNGRNDETGVPLFTPGLFSLVYAEKLYFQNFVSLLCREDFAWMRVSDECLAQAKQVLADQRIASGEAVFVHVRRGDYLGFIYAGYDNLVLDASYYEAAVMRAMADSGLGNIVVITDDPEWCRSTLSFAHSAVFLSGSELEDFTCLALARYLVCSNSTFSLAAAMLSGVLVRAYLPARWLGYNHDSWLPPRMKIEDEMIVYVD